MKQIYSCPQKQKLSGFTNFVKLVSLPICFMSLVFLFMGTTQAYSSPTCRPYFVLTDILQRFNSEEYASLLRSIKKLSQLLGKSDSASEDIKTSINKQLQDLKKSKNFSAEEYDYFVLFIRNKIKESQGLAPQFIQDFIKIDLLKEQTNLNKTQADKLRLISRTLNKYQTSDINKAFYLSSHENNFNAHTVDFNEIQLLLDAGADMNSTHGEHRQTALMQASKTGKLNIVEFLIKAGARIDLKDINGETALMHACEGGNRKSPNGNDKIVELFIKLGANLNAVNAQGETALMFAVSKGDEAVVRLLLQAKIDVDASDQNQHTALMKTFTLQDTTIAELLIAAGANLNLKNDFSQTALMIAVSNKNNSLSKILIAAKADIDIQDLNGRSALMYASKNNYEIAAQLLLAAKANVNLQDNSLSTALMYAAHFNSINILELILQAKPNLYIENLKDETVFDIEMHPAVAQLLRNYEASLPFYRKLLNIFL